MNGLRSVWISGQAWPVTPYGDGSIAAESENAAVRDMRVDLPDRNGEGRKNRWDDGLDLPGTGPSKHSCLDSPAGE